jgi:hypothetical protein
MYSHFQVNIFKYFNVFILSFNMKTLQCIINIIVNNIKDLVTLKQENQLSFRVSSKLKQKNNNKIYLQIMIAREPSGHTTKPVNEAATGCIVPCIRNLQTIASNNILNRFWSSKTQKQQITGTAHKIHVH